MKKHEIKVGGHYTAKVGGKLTTVRVDAIREEKRAVPSGYGMTRRGDLAVRYDVTNLLTNRKTTFRSAAKFRGEVKAKAEKPWMWTCACGKIMPMETSMCRHCGKAKPTTAIKPKPNTTQFGAPQTGFPEDGGTVGGPTFLPEPPKQPDAYSLDEDGNEVAAPEGEQGADPTADAADTSEPKADAPTTSASTIPSKPKDCPAPAVAAQPDPDATTTDAPSSGILAGLKRAPAKGKHPLTDEQRAIVEAAPGEPVLVIEAGAGAGKTSTLVELARALGGNGQYTAFNTSLVAESKTKFPSSCPCNTIHSLAFRSEGRRFAHRLNKGRVRTSEVAAMLDIRPMTVTGADGIPKHLLPGFLAGQAMAAVKRFCQSADREVTLRHFGPLTGLSPHDEDAVKEALLGKARKYWEDVSRPDGRLPFAHDHYVKVWQLNAPIISADYVLLDEAQDTSPVMLDVLAQQAARGTKVILVGDSAQQIYSWRGAVNALAAFPEAKRLMLSMSFRFGPVIAEVANAVLGHLESRTPLVMKGFAKIDSRLGALAEPAAVLCRTNAAAVQTLLDGIARGKRPHLIGGGADVLAFVRAARELQTGRRTEHPELACFESWSEVKEYSKTDEGADLKLMVNLIEMFGAERIESALKNMPEERDADLVVSTAHKSKGREWASVRLAADFMPLSKMGDEELRLLYVAATRAKRTLDVESCPPFCGGERPANEGWNGEGGKEPVINLAKARALSASLPAVVAEETPAEEAPAQPAPEPARRDPGRNGWTKGRNGEWLIRGRAGQAVGSTVEVFRKNGTASKEKIAKVIWQDAEVALYAVAGK